MLCRMYIILVADFAYSVGSAGREIANDRTQIWYPAKSLLDAVYMPPCCLETKEVFIMQKSEKKKKHSPWPADCIWPAPVWDGNGSLWDIDIAEMADLDEEGEQLQDIKAYYDSLVGEGILLEDYSLNEEYFLIEDGIDSEAQNDEFVLEMGDEYWDNGFDIDMWQEDISDCINRLRLDYSDASPESVIREIIGYDFINENLLRQAFTRRAFAIEHGLSGDNEQLEYLGDSVLGIMVTKEIVDTFTELNSENTDAPFCSKYDEGDLTKLRQSFVSKEYLSSRAEQLGLDRFILYGRDESPTKSSREDMIEALIGAVTIDSGWDMKAVSSVVDRLLCVQLNDPGRFLRKSFYETFNAWHMKHFGEMPDYSIDGRGPYNCVLRFSIPENDKGLWRRQIQTGRGSTRSAAREMAAELAYRYVVLKGLWINIKESGIEPSLEDSINQLQELYQKKYIEGLPEYSFEEGIRDTWLCKCICSDVFGHGSGSSKVRAKKAAAYEVLQKLFR